MNSAGGGQELLRSQTARAAGSGLYADEHNASRAQPLCWPTTNKKPLFCNSGLVPERVVVSRLICPSQVRVRRVRRVPPMPPVPPVPQPVRPQLPWQQRLPSTGG